MLPCRKTQVLTAEIHPSPSRPPGSVRKPAFISGWGPPTSGPTRRSFRKCNAIGWRLLSTTSPSGT